MPGELWHYTSGPGLVAIISTGKIFATQVACLNDNFEQRYFGDVVHAALKDVVANNTNPNLAVLFAAALRLFENSDFAGTWHFATCFSEVEDDLGQWRGYGGGECGYAIGFDSERLLGAIKSNRNDSIVVPMNYEDFQHQFLAKDVITNAQAYFLAKATQVSDIQRWAREFLEAFSWEMDIYSCMIKHPKFKGELERRAVFPFHPQDLASVVFAQKRTLLARHLPIRLTLDTGLLPISRVYVGPGPAQRVTQVSVGDLLKQNGYGDSVKVERSVVPYRIP